MYFMGIKLVDIIKPHSRERPGVHSISLLIKFIRLKYRQVYPGNKNVEKLEKGVKKCTLGESY